MPIKKRKVTYSKGAKTVTKRSGATKKTTISADGRKKTVAKTSKKGATKSRTTNMSPNYKSATITRKKDGKVVKEKKQKALTSKQAMMLSSSRGDFKSTAEKRKKQARVAQWIATRNLKPSNGENAQTRHQRLEARISKRLCCAAK